MSFPRIPSTNVDSSSSEYAITQKPAEGKKSSSAAFNSLPKGTPSQKSQLGSLRDFGISSFSNSDDANSSTPLADHHITQGKPSSIGKLPSILKNTGGQSRSTKANVASSSPDYSTLPEELLGGKDSSTNAPAGLKSADVSSEKTNEPDPFDIFYTSNSDILKMINPDYRNSRREARRTRAILDRCIDFDLSIIGSKGPALKNKIQNALAQLYPREPSPLPAINSPQPKPIETAASSIELEPHERDNTFAAFSVNHSDLKAIDPTLDFSKDYSQIRFASRRARKQLEKCITLDPTIITTNHGPQRTARIQAAMAQLLVIKENSKR